MVIFHSYVNVYQRVVVNSWFVKHVTSPYQEMGAEKLHREASELLQKLRHLDQCGSSRKGKAIGKAMEKLPNMVYPYGLPILIIWFTKHLL